MVLPVIGPTLTIDGVGGDSYRQRQKWKQAKPYDRPLPYDLRQATAVGRKGPNATTSISLVATTDHLGAYSSSWDPLIGKAYERFKASASSRASMGVTLTEFGQSYSMITTRAVQLTRFVRDLLRGNIVGAARTLKTSTVPKGASKSKSMANNFLEYQFGWAPLVSDIGAAIDVLQEPIKSVHPRGSASEPFPSYDLLTPTSGSNPNAVYPDNSTWSFFDRIDAGRRAVKMGAEIRITNTNLWLANQMGLTNPALFVYEKIPFSFIANWFFNVEQFLAISSDWHGAALENAWNTRFLRCTRKTYDHATYRWWEGSGWVYGGGLFKLETFSITQMSRGPGLIMPSLFLRPAYAPGLMRALTAMSLLVQQLKSR